MHGRGGHYGAPRAMHALYASDGPAIRYCAPLKHPVATANTFSRHECRQPAHFSSQVSRIARSVLKGSAAMCMAMQAARWGLRAMACPRGGHFCSAPSLPLRQENSTCQSALMLRPVSSSAAAIHMDGWADRLLHGGIGAGSWAVCPAVGLLIFCRAWSASLIFAEFGWRHSYIAGGLAYV